MKFLSLFAGIGGFDLGFEKSGMKCVGQVELDSFCNKVLEKHWPNIKRVKDIRDVKEDSFESVDLICGGFPCQPFSNAGKRKGKEDDRYLWPEMLRVISLYKPTWIVGENVAGIVNMELDNVCIDLESKGYEVQPIIIPACAVGAWHRRDRVWIIAYSNNSGDRTSGSEAVKYRQKDSAKWEHSQHRPCGQDKNNTNSNGIRRVHGGPEKQSTKRGEQTQCEPFKCNTDVRNTESSGFKGSINRQRKVQYGRASTGCIEWKRNWIEIATELCRGGDGISNRVDRIKALGNAVVPQIVEILGRYILEVESVG